MDKVTISHYNDYKQFYLWCQTYRPTLLRGFYALVLTEAEFKKLQSDRFYERRTRVIQRWQQLFGEDKGKKTVSDILSSELWKKRYTPESFPPMTGEELIQAETEKAAQDLLAEFIYYTSKKEVETKIDKEPVAVAAFTVHQERYLYRHCPYGFIRQYLQSRGYKPLTGIRSWRRCFLYK